MRTGLVATATLFFLSICIPLSMPACTREATLTEDPSLQVGKPVFSFAPETVEELAIEKNDPSTGDRWSVTLKPTPTEHSEPGWKLFSTGNTEITDRHADAAFVLHLLDTLRTLTFADQAAPGDDRSYGFDPPLFGLRWVVQGKRHELWIGTSHPRGRDSQDLGSRFARVGSLHSKRTIVVQGAAVQMLNMVSSLEILRRRILITIPGDDIDEFTFTSGSRSFYAQRQNDGWADARQRQLAEAVDSRVQDLIHLRIREFVDSREKATSLRKRVEAKFNYQATLKDRLGRPTILRAAWIDNQWIATESDRPDSVFILHTEARRVFETLAKGAVR